MTAAGQNVEQSYPKFFGNDAAAAKQLKVLWLGAGDADFALNGTKALDDVLTKNNIKHTLTIRPRLPARMAAVGSGSLGVRPAPLPGRGRQMLMPRLTASENGDGGRRFAIPPPGKTAP